MGEARLQKGPGIQPRRSFTASEGSISRAESRSERRLPSAETVTRPGTAYCALKAVASSWACCSATFSIAGGAGAAGATARDSASRRAISLAGRVRTAGALWRIAGGSLKPTRTGGRSGACVPPRTCAVETVSATSVQSSPVRCWMARGE